jgi:hypothetical protein
MGYAQLFALQIRASNFGAGQQGEMAHFSQPGAMWGDFHGLGVQEVK